MPKQLQTTAPPRLQTEIAALCEEARSLVHRMLDQQAAPQEVCRALWRMTGKRFSIVAMRRYATTYAEKTARHRQARAGADQFIRLAGRRGARISDLLRAVVVERLAEAQPARLQTAELLKLEDAERKRRELELKQAAARSAARHRRRELALKEKKLELDQQRLRHLRERAQAAIGRLEQKAAAGRPLSDDDLRRIREIYGIEEAE